MKARHAVIFTVLSLIQTATADMVTQIAVPINLGSPRVVHHAETDIPFNASFPLSGQQISIIFNFNTGVRVFPNAMDFFIVMRFDTNGTNLVPWGPVEGSVLDQFGNPLVTEPASAISGFNNFVFAALLRPNLGFFDFFGARFDFTAPDVPGVDITSSFFRIGANRGVYAIGLLPDSGSTVLLAAAGFSTILLARAASRLYR